MITEKENLTKIQDIYRIKNNKNLDEIKNIPRWHFAMLNDTQRNRAFFDAFESIDFSGKTVLDIGTGSGLLAMFAARNGAKHVYTCEVNSLLSEKAKKIIKVNGLQEHITVINKLSTNLISGVDLPENIDILVSETVDCGFFGEGFGHALLHAQRYLLKENAIIIPCAVSLNACLLASQDIAQLNYIYNEIYNLDISEFNTLRTMGYFPVRLQTWPHKIVSNVVKFYNSTFKSGNSFEKEGNLSFTANTNTLVHGILFWFKLNLTNDIYLTNSPNNKNSHWMQAVKLFECPTHVKSGCEYQTTLFISENGIQFGDILKPIIPLIDN